MIPLATVSLRLTPALLAQLDHAAAARGMTRSDWLRMAILDRLRDEQRQEEFHALEQRLLRRFDNLQAALMNHVTAEIDALTRE